MYLGLAHGHQVRSDAVASFASSQEKFRFSPGFKFCPFLDAAYEMPDIISTAFPFDSELM
jgi:hypothetical protein